MMPPREPSASSHLRRWRIGSREIALDRPIVMGVINVTPDSFSDGGAFFSPENALQRAEELIEQGADILDIGGESTRPGASVVAVEEEARRVIPVVEAVRSRWPSGFVSVDTNKSRIAADARAAGADIINDVSALQLDPSMIAVVASSGCGLILMHSRGPVETMASYERAQYAADAAREIAAELLARAAFAMSRGVQRESIVLDPGIGFSKQSEHSIAMLARLDLLTRAGYPVMVGLSRKRVIAEALADAARLRGAPDAAPQSTGPVDRDAGSVGASVIALARGAMLFRVHDVRSHRLALDAAWALLRPGRQ